MATPGVQLMGAMGMSIEGAGTASVQLVATSSVTSVTVVANAGGMIALSPPISFDGSVANARQLTFQCGEFAGTGSGGVHAIGAYNPDRDLIAGVKVDCNVHVADREGDGLTGQLVSFLTEAGTIGPTETTTTDVVGSATILYKTSYPLPLDVDPGVFTWNPQNDDTHTGAYLVPLWMVPDKNWTPNPIATLYTGLPVYDDGNIAEPQRPDPLRLKADGTPPTNNPRDNLVAMIAVTSGEEGYDDLNANGVHDSNEPFDDTTEPFVDSNDDGTWEAGEKFIDTNGNGKWDGKNGKYDADTLIWAQERILWTGIPTAALFDTKNNGDYGGAFPTVHTSQIGFMTPPPPVFVDCSGCVTFTFAISDPWFNSLAKNGGSDGCNGTVAAGGTPPVSVIAAGLTGLAFDYPSVGLYYFTVCDALNRVAADMTCPPQPGCFEVGQPVVYPCGGTTTVNPRNLVFTANINCTFTASPKAGDVVTIPTTVVGEVTRNTIP